METLNNANANANGKELSPVQIFLTKEELQRVKVAAGIEGKFMKDLLKRAVKEYMLKKHKGLFIIEVEGEENTNLIDSILK